MSAAIDALVCEAQATLPLASLSAATVTSGHMLYRIDQRQGPIQCSLRQCGMFAIRGNVTNFTCELAMDRDDTGVSRFDIGIDLASFELDGWEAHGNLPPASWRDLFADTSIRFRSSAVAVCAQAGQVVRGLLEFGGVTRLQALRLQVSGRRPDPITGTNLIELALSGRFTESALGIALSHLIMATALDLRLLLAVELEG